MTLDSSQPSGLTVDGVAVPQTVEADGPDAVTRYVADQHALAALTAPRPVAVVETAPNPPTFDEGRES
jgi:hypothetical protein